MTDHIHSRPHAAYGPDTLLDVLAEAEREGYSTQQIARADGKVECRGCHETSPAAAFEVHRERRLEGASDAADMMIVVWSPCPSCARLGVLTLTYGPNASDHDASVLADLDLRSADASPVDD